MRFNNKNVTLPEPIIDYLCFEALEAGSVIFTAPNGFSLSLPEPNIEYSFDKNTWTTLHASDTVSIQANEKIYFRGENPNGFTYGRGANRLETTYYTNCLYSTGRYNVSGNIMTLIDKVGNTLVIPNAYCFANLFYANGDNGKLVSAANLILPATTLQYDCYRNLFNGNTLLTTPPTILPATTLVDYCYANMFVKCSRLLEGPTIQAPIFVKGSCEGMFYQCSALHKITTYATNVSAYNCMWIWTLGVSSTGEFYNLGGANYPSGNNGIPSGWTVHTSL